MADRAEDVQSCIQVVTDLRFQQGTGTVHTKVGRWKSNVVMVRAGRELADGALEEGVRIDMAKELAAK